jgi:hypothetical protein
MLAQLSMAYNSLLMFMCELSIDTFATHCPHLNTDCEVLPTQAVHVRQCWSFVLSQSHRRASVNCLLQEGRRHTAMRRIDVLPTHVQWHSLRQQHGEAC